MDGGIVGQNNKSIENCYNAGSVTSIGGWSNNNAGGLAGRTIDGSIKNGYNYGEIIAKDANKNCTGGIVGFDVLINNSMYKVTNSYYTDTSATYSYWRSGYTHYAIGKVTEEELKGYTSTLNEKDEEGNEIEVWVNDTTGINNGYPILK